MIKNSQKIIVRRSLWLALLFALLVIVPLAMFEGEDWVFALSFVAIIAFFSSLVVAWMFHARAKKLQALIDKEELLASWKLSAIQQANYANYLFEAQKSKNRAIFTVMVFMFVVIFGIFIAVIEEDAKMPMFLTMVGSIGFLSLFAFGMPYYYYRTNARGDGEVLIGAKYAYINGYFHNWDFPLSGLSDVKVIQKPFYGIHVVYYYTDRTLKHSHEMYIPANEDSDLESIIEKMLQANPKTRKRKVLQ
jgi:hypothetical protein